MQEFCRVFKKIHMNWESHLLNLPCKLSKWGLSSVAFSLKQFHA
jgi:hypothetical protein